MHDPDVLIVDNRLIEVWHHEPGDRDSGSVCAYRSMHWHPHHWRVRFMPVVRLRRRLDRCAECGRRMNTATRFGYMGSGKVWHEECSDRARLRSDRLRMLETVDRLLFAWSVDSQENLRSLVERPERRDQFTLWYQTWRDVEWYRSSDQKWRAPNEHITGT
jgi:hypothetical protein